MDDSSLAMSEWLRWLVSGVVAVLASWFTVHRAMAERLSALEATVNAMTDWQQRLDAKIDRLLERRPHD